MKLHEIPKKISEPIKYINAIAKKAPTIPKGIKAKNINIFIT